MEVQIISDTIQKFNGESFYRCGFYFQHKGKRLHRMVWEFHNGAIPKGYHIHHRDGNRDNNSIENLFLIEGSEHHSLHMKQPERVDRSREQIKIASAFAKEWHGSEEGKAWHSNHIKETLAKRQAVKRVCAWCGQEYSNFDMSHKNVDTFCCANHKAAALRWRRKNEGKVNYPGRKV